MIRVTVFFIPALAMAAGEWEQRAPAPLAQSEFSVAEVNGEIFLMGGYPSTQITQRSVQIYNVKDDAWRMGPDLPLPNNHGTASVVDGVIYLIGGATGSSSSPGGVGYLDTVFAFDPNKGVWESKSPMPTKRRGLVSAVVDDKIYVAGGQPPQAHDFAVYDPATDTWEILPDFPTGTNHTVAEAINGKVHVVGGRLQSNHTSELTAEHVIYDPATRKWQYGPPLPRPRSGNNGILAFGCLHVWGGEGDGEDHDQMMADHDVYDPVKQEWTSLADMPFPVHGVTGAAFVDGVIHAPGGGVEAGGRSGSHLNQVFIPEMKCE
jgi:N-acetylneuraminic acid mutarotase